MPSNISSGHIQDTRPVVCYCDGPERQGMILVIFSIMLLLLSLRLASLAVYWLVVAFVIILLIIMLSLGIIVILLLVLKKLLNHLSHFPILDLASLISHVGLIMFLISMTWPEMLFLEWVVAGKPRSGLIYLRMYRTRTAFKQAFRFCRKQNEQIKADACARSCINNDAKQFWNNVSKWLTKMLLVM